MYRSLGLVVLTLGLCFADTIELKSGERLQGHLKQVTGGVAVLESEGRTTSVQVSSIRAISFDTDLPATEPPEFQNALNAVRGLRSISKAGVTYAEYSRRVLDAKIIVDRFTESSLGTAKQRYAMKAAIELYNMASRAWNSKIRAVSDGAQRIEVGRIVKNSPIADGCAPIHSRIQLLVTGSNYPPTHPRTLADIGQDAEDHLELFWVCATNRIAEVESK